MSQTEDAAITISRLLRSQLRVVKDDGGLANIIISDEWRNSDALRSCDGQVTVGLAEVADQKIDLSGRIRRRTSTLRVNVWATEVPNAAESAKGMRLKIVDAVNQVIQQNRSRPNVTVYNFIGLGPGVGSRAFSGDTEASPDGAWAELSALDYQKLWYSDDNRFQVSASQSGKSAALLLGFKLESKKGAIERLVLSFEGFGSSQGEGGVTVKFWSSTQTAWTHQITETTAETDHNFTTTLEENMADYVDDDGYVWLLAQASPSDGVIPSVLQCDYASCLAQVNGATYCDVALTRNLDRADVKPPIYRTEITVKTYQITNFGV